MQPTRGRPRDRAKQPFSGWAIWDSWQERPYIARGWPTEAEAQSELESLLKPYPERHLWRRTLTVRKL